MGALARKAARWGAALLWGAGAPAALAQAIVWQANPYPPSANAVAVGMALAAPSTIFVTGHSDEGGQRVRWLTRVDAGGALLQVPLASAPPGPLGDPYASDVPTHIAADAAGVVVAAATGTGCSPASGACTARNGALVRYDAGGGVAWTAVTPVATALASGGLATVTTEAATVEAFDLGGGTRTFFRDVGGVVASLGLAQAALADVASLPGGQFAYVGAARDPSSFRLRPLRDKFGGMPSWGSIVQPGNGRLDRIRADAAGNVYVLGASQAMSAFFPYVASFAPDGTPRWSNGSGDLLLAQELVVDPSGGTWVTGSSGFASRAVHLDASGLAVWSEAWSDGTIDSAATDGAGNLFVAGRASAGHAYVARFGPLGTRLWTTALPGTEARQVIATATMVLVLTGTAGAGPRLVRLDPGPPEPPPATVALSVAGPVYANEPVTLSAIVQGTAVPTGSVSFYPGPGATVPLCAGVALAPQPGGSARADCLLPQGVAAGAYTFVAVYSGNAVHARSTGTLSVAAVIRTDPAPRDIPALSAGALALLAAALAAAGLVVSSRSARRP